METNNIATKKTLKICEERAKNFGMVPVLTVLMHGQDTTVHKLPYLPQ